jgi:hypothetical protein
MTTFGPHRDTLESFADCINGRAGTDILDALLTPQWRGLWGAGINLFDKQSRQDIS